MRRAMIVCSMLLFASSLFSMNVSCSENGVKQDTSDKKGAPADTIRRYQAASVYVAFPHYGGGYHYGSMDRLRASQERKKDDSVLFPH